MRVMIIDDSVTARMFSKKCVKMALPDQTIDFADAADGEEALNQLKATPVDLILSDVNMPVMTGFSFITNLKMISNLASIPVIFVTSLANEARVKQLKELGAAGVISKPLKPNELVKMFEQMGISSKSQVSGDDEGWGG